MHFETIAVQNIGLQFLELGPKSEQISGESRDRAQDI
jgi:hypothetical protein